MNTDKTILALYAAGIAAGTSLFVFLFTTLSQYWADLRKSRREILQPLLPSLFERIYSVVALSAVAARSVDATARKRWLEKATQAARDLDAIRRQTRFALFRVNDAMHALVMLPRWLSHSTPKSSRADVLVCYATDLRLTLEAVVRRSYVSGTFPGAFARWKVRRREARLRNYFSVSRPGVEEEFGDDAA